MPQASLGLLAQTAQALRAACERFLLAQLPPENHIDASAAAGELGALPSLGAAQGAGEAGRDHGGGVAAADGVAVMQTDGVSCEGGRF